MTCVNILQYNRTGMHLLSWFMSCSVSHACFISHHLRLYGIGRDDWNARYDNQLKIAMTFNLFRLTQIIWRDGRQAGRQTVSQWHTYEFAMNEFIRNWGRPYSIHVYSDLFVSILLIYLVLHFRNNVCVWVSEWVNKPNLTAIRVLTWPLVNH